MTQQVNQGTPIKKGPNTILIFALFGIIALIILIAMLTSNRNIDLSGFTSSSGHGAPEQTEFQSPPAPIVTGRGHKRGAANPVMTVIEYGDFECPFCKKFHPTLSSFLAANVEEVQVIYRQLPLHIHELAREKAHASECAAELGGEAAFWQYHDMLYDRADANVLGISLSDLPTFAAELGIEEAAFNTCMASGKHYPRIDIDVSGATAAGISGTPTSVIIANDGSGTVIPGTIPTEGLESILSTIKGL